ncbi:phage major tail protein [Rhodovulum sulfidophilum]|uniref:Phage major tail protein n=1 Tax=Rhodovulum sulfidophilum TaxID=35806 RepID=A0A0D6AWX0_RHOSU|nr:phage major tail protein [Rhodovulum sulfidophilum]BAQ71254.1 phage major tail protein [Rhodovulum sulfidophilum]
MAASSGRAVLVSMGDTDLADELRTKTINFNGELIDVTADGDDGWTATLDGEFATNNVSVALEGVLKGDTLADMAFKGVQNDFTITVADLFTLSGRWQFQAGFSIAAPYNDGTTFTGTLQSVGEITKGAVS